MKLFKWPRRNLGSGELWGRAVEEQVQNLRSDLDTLQRASTTNNQQINGAINNLANLITGLQETTARLDEQQQQILETIDQLSTASVWWAATTNRLIAQAPATTDLGVISNLRVPAGYSKALVLGVSQIDLTAYSSSSFLSFQGGVCTVVGSQVGWMMPVHGYPQYEIDISTSEVQSEFQATTSASSSTVGYMEDLVDNQQIVVCTRAQVGAGDTNIYGTATTSCQAIFFK